MLDARLLHVMTRMGKCRPSECHLNGDRVIWLATTAKRHTLDRFQYVISVAGNRRPETLSTTEDTPVSSHEKAPVGLPQTSR